MKAHSDGKPPGKLDGKKGERMAARFLKRQGYRIVERNCRTLWGEIDLICLDGTTIVFVEVKSRVGQGAIEAVTLDKQRRLTRLAAAYLHRNGLLEYPARFDVVAIDQVQTRRPVLTHIRAAFEAVGLQSLYS